MNRQQKRWQMFQKNKGGQAHLSKQQVVSILTAPKKKLLTGSEFIPLTRNVV